MTVLDHQAALASAAPDPAWGHVEIMAGLLGCESERDAWQRIADAARLLLGAEIAIGMEFVCDERAVVRWGDGIPGLEHDVTLPIAPDSQAAHVMAAPGVVVVDDLAAVREFTPSAPLVHAGVRSSLGIALTLGDGERVLLGLHARAVGRFDAAAVAAFAIFADFVGRAVRHLRDRLRLARDASVDGLTGLANRATILDELGRRLGQRVRTAALLLDLDGFKAVNDRHGHRTGDLVLRTVGARIERTLGPDDRIGRLGGDEFLVLTSDDERAASLAERMIGHVEETIVAEADVVQVSASIGVARSRPDDDIGSMIERADRLMYRAKSTGRGTVHLDVDPAESGAAPAPAPVRPIASKALLEEAVAQVRVVVQPIIDARSRTVHGVEALARGPIGHPLEFPDRLFASAITHERLGELELAAKIAAFDAELPDDVVLFVNLEPSLLCDPAWLGRLQRAWAASGSSRSVTAEVTERAVLRSPGHLLRAVAACRRLGWRIALDDVGSRTESLAALRWVRPDVVKLDMRLLDGENQAHAAGVVAAIAGYRRTRRAGEVVVVAEGVETAAQEARAAVLGADLLQGYRFGRPSPSEELALAPPPPARPLGIPTFTDADVPVHAAIAARADLAHLARHVESSALTPDCVLLTAVQHADHVTLPVRRQLRAMSRRCGFVGLLGVGVSELDLDDVRGVRVADLRPDDVRTRDWVVIVMSPTTSIGLVATELDGQDRVRSDERRFRYRFVTAPDEVESIGRELLARF